MRRSLRTTALLLIAFLAATSGCSKHEDKATPAAPPAQNIIAPRKPHKVVVPDAVKGKWRAVKIAVTDKDTNQKKVYTIDIGSEIPIPESNLTLKVNYFLPAFIMDGRTMTSISNRTKNPAAQVEIRKNGKEIFKGWLFSLYPGAHAFRHPRFSFTLVDFVRSKEKSH